ncbi:MAG: BatA domain-containing protein [Planctomycetota bacterium]
MGFLNPLLLWALPLAAVPIIIHLLNKRRHRKIRWAAMEFLLRAMKRNRRRLRMEHWLILLLRTLAVVFLVFLVARPQLGGTSLGTQRTHHVLCLDDSASLAQRSGGGSAFAEAREALSNLVKSLSENRSGDLFTLLRSSDPQSTELADIRIGPNLEQRVEEVVARWDYSSLTLEPASILSAAGDRSRSNDDAQLSEIYLITDLRRQDWLSDNGEANASVSAWLQELDESQGFTLVTVGSRDSGNLAVTDMVCAERVAVLGVPLTFVIEVTNQGLTGSDVSEVTIEIDDRSRVMLPLEPLEPGASGKVAITQTFHSPGYHGVTASLPADRFPLDDSRSLALDVREFSKVFVVDGDPGESIEESESFFLAAALEPGGEQTTGMQVRILASHELGTLSEEELAEADMIWLCNLARPSPQIASRLESFASQGGGIVFFLGNQVEIDSYNQLLFRNGQGVLPAALVSVAGDMDSPSSVHVDARDHVLFSRLGEFYEFMFSQLVQVGRYVTMAVEQDDPVRVLLRIEDAEGEPLMISRSFENAGEVTVIGTSADIFWNSWPRTPAYQTICLDLHAEGAKPQNLSADNLRPSEALEIDIDPGLYRPDVSVNSLRDETDLRTYSVATAGVGADRLTIQMTDFQQYGLHALILSAHDGSESRRLFTRNPLLEEGLLEQLGQESLANTYPAAALDRVTILSASELQGRAQLAGTGGLWRWFALALLIGLLVESILAWRFGRR